MAIVTRYRHYATLNEKLTALTDRRGAHECWSWMGTVAKTNRESSGPYGRVFFGAVSTYAHRATYEEFIGRIPDGMTVDHLCENTLCQNPTHLELVTTQENSRRFQKRRLARSGRRMLTDADKATIRELYADGRHTQQELANRFSVLQSYVSHVINRTTRTDRKVSCRAAQ